MHFNNTQSHSSHFHGVNKNLELSGEVTTEEILKDIIETDQVSQEKIEMNKGVKYYSSENDIIHRDFREFFVDGIKFIDHNRSNEVIVNNLQKKLVDQKIGYISSKPFVMESDENGLIEKVTELLGKGFNDIIQQWMQGASNKGRESLQPFIDEEGEFNYCIIPAEQVVYITDTTFQKKIEQAIRYYVIEWVKDGETKKTLRVEVWDEKKVTRYQEIEDVFGNSFLQFITPGTFGININPQFHWYTFNSNFVDLSQLNSFSGVELKSVEGNGWGRVPIVSLGNNTEERSDLVPIKRYIDALDIVSSGFINDLKDIQLAIWVLRGYEGESLADFMLNLQKFKAIKLSTDDGSSAEPKTLDIPKEAREFMMKWLLKMIYEIGQGVNESEITGGSITNVVIKAMYAGLDIKANKLITKLTASLSEFMFFVVQFINERDNTDFDYKSINFVFNKSMIFNTKEIIEGLVLLRGIISDRTLIEQIPFINDPDAELKRKEEEAEEKVNSLGGGMGFGDDE